MPNEEKEVQSKSVDEKPKIQESEAALQKLGVPDGYLQLLKNDAERSVAQKNADTIMKGFGSFPALQMENEVHQKFFQYCVADTTGSIDVLAEFAQKWGIVIKSDRDMGELADYCKFGIAVIKSVIPLYEKSMARCKEWGFQIKAVPFCNSAFADSDTDKDWIMGIRRSVGHETFLTSVSEAASLKNKLHIFRMSESTLPNLPRPRWAQMQATQGARRRRIMKKDTATTSDEAKRRISAQPFGLRRQAAIFCVAPPRRTPGSTPSSSLLGSGRLALATRLARDSGRGS
jgi:hypothetical protein